MLPIRRILAPTDFSSRSCSALDVAAELAQHFGAELVLVHVISPLPTAMPTAAGQMPLRMDLYRDAVLEDAQDKLDELAGARIPDGVTTRKEVPWGSAAETIVELADTTGSDLIVICTRGATGLSRFVSGSVTEKVVRLSNIPVLTVQAEDDD
jgi:nucleotide-binding universal stress UspA family protein